MSFWTAVAEWAIDIWKPVTAVWAGMRALGALAKSETLAVFWANVTWIGAVILWTGWLLKQALK